MRTVFILLLALGIPFLLKANVHVSPLWSNGMVVQQQQPIRIWGWADAGEPVTVTIGSTTRLVKTAANGQWQIQFPARKAGPAFSITIAGKNTIHIKDVLAGEVWLCSGQSNMEWPVALSLNATTATATANYPDIRMFEVEKKVSLQPVKELEKGSWVAASPATAGRFSAIGFFYARKMYETLGVPIGIINASIGGTHIETWMSSKALQQPMFGNTLQQMPTATVAELNENKKQLMLQKIKQAQGHLPETANTHTWINPGYNDATWPSMKVPGYWEPQGWENLNGKVWYRLHINVTEAVKGKKAVLHLGQIDDSDSVWINGRFVGNTHAQPGVKRMYTLPKDLVLPGENTLVVMVEDTGGGGGFIGGAGSMFLEYEGKKISIEGEARYQISVVYSNGFQVYPNDYPTLLFNAMIYPLLSFRIKGVLWYQGESNAARATQYGTSFPLMINDWRQQWGIGDFPFLFVQLASFNAHTTQPGKSSSWAELRAAQEKALALRNTCRVVTIDVGDSNDIHPRDKETVALRLAACALHTVYGKKVPFQSPVFASYNREAGAIRIRLLHAANGLVVKDGCNTVHGFEIAGAGADFIPAYAKIENNTILVYHPDVPHPEAVRFAWKDDAGEANVFNKEGLPLAPFRTDERPLQTQNSVYRIGL